MATNDWRGVWRRLTQRGAYPHQFAFLLLLPLRSVIFSPCQLVSRLQLAETSRVLELGPGPGFFSERVARSIPGGHLYLVDLQHQMLARARRRVRRAGLRNVSFTQATATVLPFEPGSFDTVFLVAVLGEVPDAGACVESVCHVLRHGGMLSVTELPGDPDLIREPDLIALVCAKGFEHLESFPVMGRGYTANFRKAVFRGTA